LGIRVWGVEGREWRALGEDGRGGKGRVIDRLSEITDSHMDHCCTRAFTCWKLV